MKTTIAILALLLAACDVSPMATESDAGTALDSGTDATCTEWGCVVECTGGTCGCSRYVCTSYEPQPCPLGPQGIWCSDAGAVD